MKRSFILPVAAVAMLSACNATSGTKHSAVHFDMNSDRLTQQERVVLGRVADNIKDHDRYKMVHNDTRVMDPIRIRLYGHTDTLGNAEYNKKLAERRVKSVKHELIKQGVNPKLIEVVAKGEAQPKVMTGDGVQERLNRRVDIVIDK